MDVLLAMGMTPGLKQGLWAGLRVGLLAYGGLCIWVFATQARHVYYPSRDVRSDPGSAGLSFERLRLTAADGERIAAWFVPARESEAPVVLYCHGNAGNIGDRISALRVLHDLGLSVLIFDYRGYGDSSGRPTEEGTYLDARAAWDWLAEERRVPPSRIVLYGRSLGGSVAVWLAGQVRPAALVVESTFTSAPDMAREVFPFLPKFLCRFRYDSARVLPAVEAPVLVAHGRGDEMIPYEQGRRLYELAPEPKTFVELSGGHNTGGLEVDEDYQRRLASFLRERGVMGADRGPQYR